MSSECNCNSNQVMILACSGGSNVGQLSNQAAVELTKEGIGTMFCLAGIGGKLSGFVQSARDVSSVVVMDGCEIGCAKAIFKEADVELRGHIVLTDLGIEKNKNLDLKADDLTKIKDAARKAIA